MILVSGRAESSSLWLTVYDPCTIARITGSLSDWAQWDINLTLLWFSPFITFKYSSKLPLSSLNGTQGVPLDSDTKMSSKFGLVSLNSQYIPFRPWPWGPSIATSIFIRLTFTAKFRNTLPALTSLLSKCGDIQTMLWGWRGGITALCSCWFGTVPVQVNFFFSSLILKNRRVFVIYYFATNLPWMGSLKQNTFINSQFLWIRSLGMT